MCNSHSSDPSHWNESGFSRRGFLRSGTALGFTGLAGGLSVLNAGDAYASVAGGYKAMVCLDLQGGMDGMDVLLPKDAESFDQLAVHRPGLFTGYGVGSGTSTRDRENIVELNPENASDFGTRRFGFAPEMAPLARMFDDGDMAVVGSVGPLVEPVSRETMSMRRLPKRLFSHNSQQSLWLTGDLEGRRPGWGGEFLDAVVSGDRTFAGLATRGTPFLNKGDAVRRFDLPVGAFPRTVFERSSYVLRSGARSERLRQIMNDHIGSTDVRSDNPFQRDMDAVHATGLRTTKAFMTAYDNRTPVATEFPSNWVGEQMRAIANAIAMRGALNVGNRQMFYAQRFGFDFHGAQTGMIDRMGNIAGALSAFRDAMIEIGMWDDVIVFTTSDFGRTLGAGGSGTDHGWGSHHFVMGGSVAGRRIVGDVIPPDREHPQWTAARPRMIPTTSVDQYASSLGRWFGMDEGALDRVFPNLGNFDMRDLGLFA